MKVTSNSIGNPDHPWRAFVWMVSSGLLFSVMAATVKALSTGLPIAEIVFFRSFATTLIFGSVMAVRGESFFPARRTVLVVRALAGFAALSCYFYTISVLPLSIAVILNWCSPLFVILFSRIFLGEWGGPKVLFWSVAAFFGMVLLTRPDLAAFRLGVPVVPFLIGLLSAVFAGLAMVSVRVAAGRFSSDVIVFYFSFISTVIVAPVAYLHYSPPDPRQWAGLAVMGGLAAGAQWAMTRAYRFAQAGLVSTVGLVNPAFSVLWGALFFGEFLAPVQWTGLVLLAVSVTLVTRAPK